MNVTSAETGITIDDHYFANLRPLRHYSERVCFVASIVCNSVLAILLIREKDATMKPYSRVLLINVAFDYVYTVVSMAVEPEVEVNGGIYIFIANGFIPELSPTQQKLAMSLWVVSCGAASLVSTLEFTFRYLLVVKEYRMACRELALGAFLVVICSVHMAVCFYLAMDSVEDPVAGFGHLMTHPMWQGGHRMVYYGVEKTNVFFLLFTFSATILDTGILLIIVLSTVATMAVLRKSRHLMSGKTRYMQSQLNRLMFAEVFSLVSVTVIPHASIMPLVFLNVKYVGFGVLIIIFFQWIPIVNPVTTIFLVGPYRRQIFRPFCRRVGPEDMSKSAAYSVGRLTSR